MTDQPNAWLEVKKNELLNAWSDIEFIEKTIQQINKDFASCNETIFFDANDSNIGLQELIDRVKMALLNIEKQAVVAIPQLIYQIDIPENVYHSIVNHSEDLHRDLAELIVIREAYKVWFRSKY